MSGKYEQCKKCRSVVPKGWMCCGVSGSELNPLSGSTKLLKELYLAIKRGEFNQGQWNFDVYDKATRHLKEDCGCSEGELDL